MAENQNAELAAEFAPHFGRSLLFAGIATLRRSSCGAGSTTKRPRPPEGERGHVKAGCV
jgi:hypothetical protein